MVSELRSSYADADRWLRDHVFLWWLLLATIPGGSYALFDVLLQDAPTSAAVVSGVVFGGVFATVTVALRRLRNR